MCSNSSNSKYKNFGEKTLHTHTLMLFFSFGEAIQKKIIKQHVAIVYAVITCAMPKPINYLNRQYDRNVQCETMA